MARRFDPRLVGAFVVASLALGVGAAIYLGAGRLLQHRVRFVVVFQEDLAGLETDAPVKFRGVPVGRVASIHLSIGSAEEPLRGLRMPVVIELNQSRIQKMGGTVDLTDPQVVRKLIGHGLRARLALESFLSNRRYVDLDILPGAPPAQPTPIKLPYPEIPVYVEPGWAALQADASKLLAKLQALDLEGLLADLRGAVRSIDRAAGRLDQAAGALPATLGRADAAIAAVRDAAQGVEAEVRPLGAGARDALERLRAAIDRAEVTFGHVDALVAPDAPLAAQLGAALEELRGAGRAVRQLADSVDQDPASLLRGRQQEARP